MKSSLIENTPFALRLHLTLWIGPGFKPLSPESNNSKLKWKLEFLYWSLEKKTRSVQRESFYILACVYSFIGKKNAIDYKFRYCHVRFSKNSDKTLN